MTQVSSFMPTDPSVLAAEFEQRAEFTTAKSSEYADIASCIFSQTSLNASASFAANKALNLAELFLNQSDSFVRQAQRYLDNSIGWELIPANVEALSTGDWQKFYNISFDTAIETLPPVLEDGEMDYNSPVIHSMLEGALVVSAVVAFAGTVNMLKGAISRCMSSRKERQVKAAQLKEDIATQKKEMFQSPEAFKAKREEEVREWKQKLVDEKFVADELEVEKTKKVEVLRQKMKKESRAIEGIKKIESTFKRVCAFIRYFILMVFTFGHHNAAKDITFEAAKAEFERLHPEVEQKTAQ